MNVDITEWIDTILSAEIPQGIIALNFNLYDDGESNWAMELIGTSNFDLNDKDWAGDEIFDFKTRNNPLKWVQNCSWEDILNESVSMIKNYLENGRYSALMKTYKGIGIGFVDGDIEIVYQQE